MIAFMRLMWAGITPVNLDFLETLLSILRFFNFVNVGAVIGSINIR